MTPAQLTTLKAAILAETDPTFVQLRNGGATGAMAEWFNVDSTFTVWRTTTPLGDVSDAITWANLTPNDAADGTTAWTNRSLACQGKQFNLQLIFGAQGQVNTGKANVRAGLQDALSNVPSGAGGALVSAGWLSVKAAIYRFATRGEKLFAIGTGTTATPGNLVFEGQIRNEDVVLAING